MTNAEWLETMASSWRTMMSMNSSPDKIRAIATELRAASAAIDAFISGDTERALALAEQYKRMREGR